MNEEINNINKKINEELKKLFKKKTLNLSTVN